MWIEQVKEMFKSFKKKMFQKVKFIKVQEALWESQ